MGGTFAALVIPVGIVLNLILVRLKLTKTLNVDIWNYMHFLVPGAPGIFCVRQFYHRFLCRGGFEYCGSVYWRFDCAQMAKYYGLEGTTCTTMIHIGWTLPFAGSK